VTSRREFITLLGGAAVAWPLTGLAQEAGRVRRIGFLRVGEPPAAFIDGFRRGLREVGLVEDRDFIIEFALPQNTAQVPDAAAELVPAGWTFSWLLERRQCCRRGMPRGRSRSCSWRPSIRWRPASLQASPDRAATSPA